MPNVLWSLLIHILLVLSKEYKQYKLAKGIIQNENSRKCQAYQNGEFSEKDWGSLIVGDIVKLSENECCPADLVLVYSTNEDMSCYIDNSKHTGETELQVKEVVEETFCMYQ
jgi:P-type E1-E2 ATPase